jgi:hypothetical protein
MGRRETLVVVGALLLTAATSAAAFAQAAAAKPQPASPPKFVSPFKGEAAIEMTPATSRTEGNVLVTTFKVKNMSPGPLVGFKVEEYWYSKKNETVSGSPSFRHLKPLMPGEVIEVTLRSPRHPEMATKMTTFGHANGKVKPKQVPKFSS